MGNEEIDVLEEYISVNNLKITKQRRSVLKIFLECKACQRRRAIQYSTKGIT